MSQRLQVFCGLYGWPAGVRFKVLTSRIVSLQLPSFNARFLDSQRTLRVSDHGTYRAVYLSLVPLTSCHCIYLIQCRFNRPLHVLSCIYCVIRRDSSADMSYDLVHWLCLWVLCTRVSLAYTTWLNVPFFECPFFAVSRLISYIVSIGFCLDLTS